MRTVSLCKLALRSFSALVLVLVLAVGTREASAASISWSAPIDASTNLPLNNGSVIEAVNSGGPAVTINGINFKDGDAGEMITNSNLVEAFPDCCSDNGMPTGADANMEMMLNSHRWLGSAGQAAVATLKLQGLEVGKKYQVQMYYSDFRPGSFKEYYYAGDNGSISELFRRGTTVDNTSFIGTFTADSSEQRVLVIPAGTRADGFVNHDPGNSGYVLSRVVDLFGDFDGSGALDLADIDQLAAAIRANSTDLKFDVTADRVVSSADHTSWVKDVRKTWIGDSNLNGEFNSSDFVDVFQAGKYETGQTASWSQGDWNGDNQFNSADFVLGFQDGGYEKGPRPAIGAVPEPSAFVLVLAGLLVFSRRR